MEAWTSVRGRAEGFACRSSSSGERCIAVHSNLQHRPSSSLDATFSTAAALHTSCRSLTSYRSHGLSRNMYSGCGTATWRLAHFAAIPRQIHDVCDSYSYSTSPLIKLSLMCRNISLRATGAKKKIVKRL